MNSRHPLPSHQTLNWLSLIDWDHLQGLCRSSADAAKHHPRVHPDDTKEWSSPFSLQRLNVDCRTICSPNRKIDKRNDLPPPDRAARFSLVIRSIGFNSCLQLSSESLIHYYVQLSRATGRRYEVSCWISRAFQERRGNPAYIYWNPSSVQVRTAVFISPPPSRFLPFLFQNYGRGHPLDSWCCLSRYQHRRNVYPLPNCTLSITRLTVGQRLTGVACTQVLVYFRRYQRDKASVKFMVSSFSYGRSCGSV